MKDHLKVVVHRDDNGTILKSPYEARWDRTFTDKEVAEFKKDPYAVFREQGETT